MLTIAQVKSLQGLLKERGRPVLADGVFGPETQDAVYAVLFGRLPAPGQTPIVPPLPHVIRSNRWPQQEDCDQFYGNPRGPDGNVSQSWYATNVTKIAPPFKVLFGHIPITKIAIHKKCAESASRILNVTWEKIGKDQAKADALGISKFSGSFNYRVIRGGNRLSMHAYACAWDWDAPENMMNDPTPLFTKDHPFAVAHAEEGWTWGGLWTGRSDAMHWQAARV